MELVLVYSYSIIRNVQLDRVGIFGAVYVNVTFGPVILDRVAQKVDDTLFELVNINMNNGLKMQSILDHRNVPRCFQRRQDCHL